MLATNQEQRKPASTSKGTKSTKRHQFDRRIQAFAGYSMVKTGRVQRVQMPVFSRYFVQQMPDFILQMPDFDALQKLVIF